MSGSNKIVFFFGFFWWPLISFFFGLLLVALRQGYTSGVLTGMKNWGISRFGEPGALKVVPGSNGWVKSCRRCKRLLGFGKVPQRVPKWLHWLLNWYNLESPARPGWCPGRLMRPVFDGCVSTGVVGQNACVAKCQNGSGMLDMCQGKVPW